jgi:hypothetical protein
MSSSRHQVDTEIINARRHNKQIHAKRDHPKQAITNSKFSKSRRFKERNRKGREITKRSHLWIDHPKGSADPSKSQVGLETNVPIGIDEEEAEDGEEEVEEEEEGKGRGGNKKVRGGRSGERERKGCRV